MNRGGTQRNVLYPARQRSRNAGDALEDAVKHDCDACELKPRCCPKMPARKVPRSIHERARDVARDIAKTDGLCQVPARTEEDRDALRSPQAHPAPRPPQDEEARLGARDEFLLAATAQNLRKLAKLIPMPCAPARLGAIKHPSAGRTVRS